MLKSLTKFVLLASFLPTLLSANFKVSDFRGDFFFYGATSSALIIETGPVLTPTSNAEIGQLTFDRHGNGVFNFLSASILAQGRTISPYQCPSVNTGGTTVKLNLLDEKLGTGTLVVSDFPGFEKLTYDFVATKRGGKVVKIVTNRAYNSVANPTCATPANETLGATDIILLTLERQGT